MAVSWAELIAFPEMGTHGEIKNVFNGIGHLRGVENVFVKLQT